MSASPCRPPLGLTPELAPTLEHGSNAHYQDAGYYSATYADRAEDIDYYLRLVADRAAGELLEYGCGNGRIALPLAHCGSRVTGVDRSAPMLADFRRRLRMSPRPVRERVVLRRGDMRSLRLERRFALVLCTFNTFLHLYSRRDVERFCARVIAHLKPRGRFVLDVSLPDPEELSRDPNRLLRCTPFRHRTTGQVVRYGERFDYEPLAQVLSVDMEFEPREQPNERWNTPLTHRQFFPQELEALLHYNGLEVVDAHGDFAQRAPDRDSTTLILHCRRRRGW